MNVTRVCKEPYSLFLSLSCLSMMDADSTNTSSSDAGSGSPAPSLYSFHSSVDERTIVSIYSYHGSCSLTDIPQLREVYGRILNNQNDVSQFDSI
jgi:hypothetical protein